MRLSHFAAAKCPRPHARRCIRPQRRHNCAVEACGSIPRRRNRSRSRLRSLAQSRCAGALLGTYMRDIGGKSGRRPGRHLQVEASGPGNAASACAGPAEACVSEPQPVSGTQAQGAVSMHETRRRARTGRARAKWQRKWIRGLMSFHCVDQICFAQRARRHGRVPFFGDGWLASNHGSSCSHPPIRWGWRC